MNKSLSFCYQRWPKQESPKIVPNYFFIISWKDSSASLACVCIIGHCYWDLSTICFHILVSGSSCSVYIFPIPHAPSLGLWQDVVVVEWGGFCCALGSRGPQMGEVVTVNTTLMCIKAPSFLAKRHFPLPFLWTGDMGRVTDRSVAQVCTIPQFVALQ